MLDHFDIQEIPIYGPMVYATTSIIQGNSPKPIEM